MKLLPKSLNTQQISRHRSFIYGFAALMILFFHMGTNIPNRGALKILRILQDLSCCGVEMFLLLSGFGLARSMEREPSYKRFCFKRIARVIPPLVICGICFDIALYRGPYASAVGRGFVLDYLISSAVWYVTFIVLMYLLFPFVNRVRKHRPAMLRIAVIAFTCFSFALETVIGGPRASEIMRMVSRIPVFLLGCALAPWEMENRRISRLSLHVLAVISLALIAAWRKNLLPVWEYSLRMLCFTASAMTIILLLALLVERRQGRLYRFIAFCGAYSLEIYLVFARLRALIELIPGWGGFASIKMDFAAAVLTILISALIGEICKRGMRALSVTRNA